MSSRERLKLAPELSSVVALSVAAVLAGAVVVGVLAQKSHHASFEIVRAEELRKNLELKARLRTKPASQRKDQQRDGSWLCERYRCNEGDVSPAWYQQRDDLPHLERERFDKRHLLPRPDERRR